MSIDKHTEQYLVRTEIALSPLSLLNCLKHLECDTKIYWACRRGDLEIAGFGLVDSIDITNTSSCKQAVFTVEERLNKSSPQIRYYGGQCFDLENIDPATWGGFYQYRFVVPEYEIIRKNNTYTLARNVRVTCDVDTEQLRQNLLEYANLLFLQTEAPRETSHKEKSRSGLSRKDFPCHSEWISLTEELINAIQAGYVEKVVLAHKADLISTSTFDPVALLERVKNLSCQTYTFLYQFPNSGVFLGASPECLFKKDGTDIYSEAIAGTRAATGDPETNIKLQKELRQSAKELQEHDYVADNIQDALQRICQDVSCIESYDILQTASVQHLYTRFQGKLKNNVNIHHILETLHPTAAVNGFPSREAIKLIRKLEPFSRGWYAGAVGWIASEQAEFAVAIRSALVQQNRTISIFSGAGIVKDSDPEREWEETELKKRLILETAKEII